LDTPSYCWCYIELISTKLN